jgi:cytochrome c oxidase cbb3-type subunit I/II
MPPYPWLFTAQVDPEDIAASVRAMTIAGTPYPEMSLADVSTSMLEEGNAIVANLEAVNLSAEPLDEIVALIAYMQRLGTDIDAILAAEAGIPLAAASEGGDE